MITERYWRDDLGLSVDPSFVAAHKTHIKVDIIKKEKENKMKQKQYGLNRTSMDSTQKTTLHENMYETLGEIDTELLLELRNSSRKCEHNQFKHAFRLPFMYDFVFQIFNHCTYLEQLASNPNTSNSFDE
uniref:Uncharacterized protein n=1 Tax=Glossina austeni TaxID=7395 RepID=A0A1A9VKT0_GLOAU